MLEKVRLGRTGLDVSRVAMGCIPIQRLPLDGAVSLIRKAVDAGVNFFDSAHVYSDSEEKMGAAFAGIRDKVVIATKTMSDTYEKAMHQIDESLRRLRTDYIDLYQWHNPEDFDAGTFREAGPYRALLDARKAGKIRFIGMTNHNIDRARGAIESGAFDTLQFPLSVLSAEREIEFSLRCAELDVGFIAMKAMAGGMLPDGRLPFIFLNQHRHVVPIWGMEREEELAQFVRLSANPEPFTPAMRAEIDALRADWGDEYCRGCGYCLPCPAEIPIPMAARISLLLGRSVAKMYLSEDWQKNMARIKDCVDCGQCKSRCPYGLDTPNLLKEEARKYNEYLKTH